MTPVEIIVGEILTSATVVYGASLSFARWLLKHQANEDAESPDGKRRAIDEKRRILERDRAEWIRIGVNGGDNVRPIARIDKKLLALAEEEARATKSE